MTTITPPNLLELCMIVKNSGSILRQCLVTNKKWIDHWTIIDTGSTDDTMLIIKDVLEDIPGRLFQEEFIDFSQARNKALDLCSGTCKYIITLDDSYVIHGGDSLRKLLKKDKAVGCWLINIGKLTDNNLQDSYYSKRIIKTAERLRYVYRVHEDIQVSEKKIKVIPDGSGIFIDDLTFTEHSKRSRNRYNRDIDMLLLDHADNPTEPRTIYYLAKTHFILENYNDAIKYYDLLKSIRNVREDFLFSSHYDKACIQFALDNNVDTLKSAMEFISELFYYRPEPVYKLAVIAKDSGDNDTAYKLTSKILGSKKPLFMGTLLETDIYDYYIDYLYIDVNLALGNMYGALPILKSLVSKYPNDQPLLNMKYSICDTPDETSLYLSDGRTVVIHTGSSDIVYCWDPRENDPRISGSEFMALNLAREFQKLEYRVVIIGTFDDPLKKLNYEGAHDGIEYIDYKYFSEFALKYVIDYLIVSRYATNLVYYKNIKRVYLWMHDVLPMVDDNARFIQFHKTKFKCLVAITDWQKQNTVSKLNIPPERITVLRNAIDTQRFKRHTVPKVPYRFIYSSCPERGLDLLIEIIPRIKIKYPETTLHIFALRERITTKTLITIEGMEYVVLHSRVNQEELAVEFLKSDIWLYPTHFPEAYCITALEAMAAKCLVATVDYCGLGNVASGRGVLCLPPVKDNLEILLDKLYFTMDNITLKNHLLEKGYDWAMKQTCDGLAQEWTSKVFVI